MYPKIAKVLTPVLIVYEHLQIVYEHIVYEHLFVNYFKTGVICIKTGVIWIVYEHRISIIVTPVTSGCS